MDVLKQEVFQNSIQILPLRIQEALNSLSNSIKENILEIRLRLDTPIVLKTFQGSYYINQNKSITQIFSNDLLIVFKQDLEEILGKACEYSVYSHQEDIKKGFLTIPGGHRLGLAGTATSKSNGEIYGMRNITSINFRISQNVDGCADVLINSCFQEKTLKNILIIGPPMSGKTVLLRDLCRQISNGVLKQFYTCVVIDERMELYSQTKLKNKVLGIHTDVISGYSKEEGIPLAVRALSPTYIFCDEIGSTKDSDAIMSGILSGVFFVATVHANSLEDAVHRIGVKSLIQNQCIDDVILLGTNQKVGQIEKIIHLREDNEISRYHMHFNSRNFGRTEDGFKKS